MQIIKIIKNHYWFFAWLAWLTIFYTGLITINFIQPGVNFGDYFRRWDSNWYITIIEHGYQKPPYVSTSNVAFFPLLPSVIILFTKVGISGYYVGAAVSSLMFLASLYFLQKLLLKNFNLKITILTLSLIALNPFSFFFGLLYTESLFLLLSVLLFLFLYQKNYWAAAVIASLAGLARSTGLLLVLIFTVTIIYNNRRSIKQKALTIISQLLIAVSGFIGWLIFLKLYAGDFLAFYHIQKFWLRNSPNNLLWQFEYMYNGILNMHLYSYFMLINFLATLLLVFGGIYWVIHKNYMYSLFCFGVAFLGLASFSVTSMNRYALVVFPAWLAISLLPILQNIRLRYIIPILCLALFCGVIMYGYTPVIFVG